MGYTESRLDVKSGSESKAFATKFTAKHYELYINKPKDGLANGCRLTTTVGDVIPLIAADDFYKAVRANIVHACDAKIVRSLIIDFDKLGRPITTIHDCAGVRALDRDLLADKLKATYSGLEYKIGGVSFRATVRVTGSFVFL
jgi:hypothetical protein